ncbi:hypothetical protein CF327_g7608 [Tilletia walkeri]|nr:hypothetical protein CF327_g7608 [Tilletia walkeri]
MSVSLLVSMSSLHQRAIAAAIAYGLVSGVQAQARRTSPSMSFRSSSPYLSLTNKAHFSSAARIAVAIDSLFEDIEYRRLHLHRARFAELGGDLFSHTIAPVETVLFANSSLASISFSFLPC